MERSGPSYKPLLDLYGLSQALENMSPQADVAALQERYQETYRTAEAVFGPTLANAYENAGRQVARKPDIRNPIYN